MVERRQRVLNFLLVWYAISVNSPASPSTICSGSTSTIFSTGSGIMMAMMTRTRPVYFVSPVHSSLPFTVMVVVVLTIWCPRFRRTSRPTCATQCLKSRLNALLLLFIHRSIPLDPQAVVDHIARSQPRRLLCLNPLADSRTFFCFQLLV